MASYYCGLKINTLAASTFTFATICLSRLLHGLSSRNEKPIYQIRLFSNKQSIHAFFDWCPFITSCFVYSSFKKSLFN